MWCCVCVGWKGLGDLVFYTFCTWSFVEIFVEIHFREHVSVSVRPVCTCKPVTSVSGSGL